VLRVARDAVATTEGRAHFELGGARVGLVSARQVLELPEAGATTGAEQAVVVIGEAGALHGLAVDALRGEEELVVRPLDPRLGKVPDIAAAAVLADGSPVLFLDLEDMRRSIERLAAGGRLGRWTREVGSGATRRRRVLVVDDSLTVRELERKLLVARGYEVEVAVDGMAGWHAARQGGFDLVITDVDMPRMDGIELTTAIKADARLSATPVMIVSYKDREEDRRRGLEAGADYYLTKGSFQDDSLLEAVADLVGPAEFTADAEGRGA
jgi:two-component system sensor histidine kinase and response regulator WspE